MSFVEFNPNSTARIFINPSMICSLNISPGGVGYYVQANMVDGKTFTITSGTTADEAIEAVQQRLASDLFD